MSGILNSIYNNASYTLQSHTEILARLQEQASTGSYVNRVSDEPTTAYRILGLNSQQSSLENYIDNLSSAMTTLELSSTIVGDMLSTLTETKTRLTQISSGIYGEDGQQQTAEVINDALEQILALANTEHAGQYLFGGSNTSSAPYVAEYTYGEITNVTYQGGSDHRDIEVASNIQISVFYSGESLFHSDSRSDPVFLSDTGAKAGTGTSNVTGDVWLTVINDGSNYQISIDDGASYTTVPIGGDTNQAVTDSRTGKVLYVDTTELSSTGVELVRIPGTYDIFNTLITIRDILKNERGLSEAQLQELVLNSLDSLNEVMNLMTQDQTCLGAKVSFLDNLEETLTNIKYNAEDEVTRLQEVDITQVAIDISRHEILYQMSLSVTAKLLSMSLMNYID